MLVLADFWRGRRFLISDGDSDAGSDGFPEFGLEDGLVMKLGGGLESLPAAFGAKDVQPGANRLSAAGVGPKTSLAATDAAPGASVSGLERGEEEQEFAPAGRVWGLWLERPCDISPYQPSTGQGLEETEATAGDAHHVRAHGGVRASSLALVRAAMLR